MKLDQEFSANHLQIMTELAQAVVEVDHREKNRKGLDGLAVQYLLAAYAAGYTTAQIIEHLKTWWDDVYKACN